MRLVAKMTSSIPHTPLYQIAVKNNGDIYKLAIFSIPSTNSVVILVSPHHDHDQMSIYCTALPPCEQIF